MSFHRPVLVLACVSVLAVAGCARPPGNVRPVPVSSLQFADMSCGDLAKSINETFHARKALEKRQINAVVADTAGVYTMLVPPSLIAGDTETALAESRGTEVALRRAHQVQCR